MMKNKKNNIQPSIFEKYILASPEVFRPFFYIFVLLICYFNMNAALQGKWVVQATNTSMLALCIVVLVAIRNKVQENVRILVYRICLRGIMIIFGAFQIYYIGIAHHFNRTPWAFLFIFLNFLIMQKEPGRLISLLFIGGLALAIGITPDVFIENAGFLIRFFICLILVSLISYSSLKVRLKYLNDLERTKSDLEKSEKEARQLSEKLLAEIEHRDKIEKKLHQAIKMETVGNLASGVAHDLNNILSGIVTYPDLLLLDLKKEDPAYKPVMLIKKSGMTAAAIVEDLLTLSRRGVKVSDIVDLREIVDEYLGSPEFTALMSFHPGIRFKTRFDSDLMNIKGSSVHLSKIIMNLVSNAAEAMPEGGEVLIGLNQQALDKEAAGAMDMPWGDYVVLSVLDAGIGMSKENLDRIFEPFYTKKVMGRSGTGLGMAVVQGTVLDHGGYIDIKSTPGKGTVVTVYFPGTIEVTRNEQNNIKIKDITGNNEKILVIDDIPEQREIAEDILKRLGYQTVSCSSGEDAVAFLKENHADLLIIDMVMDPGIDGLETYKEVLKFKPGQKAVFATGFSITEKMKNARELGAGQHLLKPYSLENIGIVIQKELAK